MIQITATWEEYHGRFNVRIDADDCGGGVTAQGKDLKETVARAREMIVNKFKGQVESSQVVVCGGL